MSLRTTTPPVGQPRRKSPLAITRVILAATAVGVIGLVAPAHPASADSSATIQEQELGFCGVDGNVESEWSGFSRDGYANTDNDSGRAVQWAVQADRSGTYEVEVRYANGADRNRPGRFNPDGARIEFTSTGSWDSWASASTSIDLDAGVNLIELEARSGDGLPNVDRLRISGADGVTAGRCDGTLVDNGDQDNGDQDNGDQDNGDQDNGDQDNGDQDNGDQEESCGLRSPDVVVEEAGGAWRARSDGTTIASGAFLPTMDAAMNAGSRIVVDGDPSLGSGERIRLRSNLTLDFCGTVRASGSGTMAIYGRSVSDVEIVRLRVSGSPDYGIFLRNVEDIKLGDIDLRLSRGLGLRIDNHGDRNVRSRNIEVDDVYVSGTSAHGVETYGVDGITIDRVVARDTGFSGLILNDTWNATIGTVDAEGAGTGTGYAAFRTANRNGRISSSYPTNIRVDRVIARGGGRGVFCVSESGGLQIDRIDLRDTGNSAVLIENCRNVRIGGGSINGGGEVRLAARSDFFDNRSITIRNVTMTNTRLRESPCGDDIDIANNVFENTVVDIC